MKFLLPLLFALASCAHLSDRRSVCAPIWERIVDFQKEREINNTQMAEVTNQYNRKLITYDEYKKSFTRWYEQENFMYTKMRLSYLVDKAYDRECSLQ